MTVTAIPPQTTGEQDEVQEKKGGRRKFLVALALVLAISGGGWYYAQPSGDPEPVPGEVLPLEAIQLNLAGGHYLRLGLALQLADGAESVDGSKALDAAITTFSGREMAKLVRAQDREALRGELLEQLDAAYEGQVLEVYFTEFVTQ